MRNAANDVDAKIECALEQSGGSRVTKITVLWKRYELQIEIGLHAALDLEQCFDGQQPWVTDIRMTADRKQSLGDRPIAVSERPFDHCIDGQERLELTPKRDTLQQRTRAIEPRQSEAECCIHVEMR